MFSPLAGSAHTVCCERAAGDPVLREVFLVLVSSGNTERKKEYLLFEGPASDLPGVPGTSSPSELKTGSLRLGARYIGPTDPVSLLRSDCGSKYHHNQGSSGVSGSSYNQKSATRKASPNGTCLTLAFARIFRRFSRILQPIRAFRSNY